MVDRVLAEDNLLYKVRTGSHAYGMATETSDVDIAGVFLPPVEYYFGLQSFDLLNESSQGEDVHYYSLRKFIHLAANSNPNVLELLFVDDEDVLYCHPAFARFREHRSWFLSQEALKPYLGYANQQLHRIRNHNTWIEKERRAMDVLVRALWDGKICREWVGWRFGQNLIERLEQEFENLKVGIGTAEYYRIKKQWVDQPKTREMDDLLAGLDDTGLAHRDKSEFVLEQPGDMDKWQPTLKTYDLTAYKLHKKQRHQYMEWMASRNPDRHRLELKYGYDTKHGAHLVRLLRTGKEILTEGRLQVRRSDAQELLAIRQGAWSYDYIVNYAWMMMDAVKRATPVVQAHPARSQINQLLISITEEIFDERRKRSAHTSSSAA